MAYTPYPKNTKWEFTNKKGGLTRQETLLLSWEASCDPVSDDYTYHDTDADDLWRIWVEYLHKRDQFDERLGKGWVRVSWFVEAESTFEGAPFDETARQFGSTEDFLTFFNWPTNVDTGERVNWMRLPVRDKLWTREQTDKGGFIQEASGWKPSAYQPFVYLPTLAAAASLYWPAP